MDTKAKPDPNQAKPHPKLYMYKRIVDAKLYIDLHFREKIDLENISNQASFSKYHFLRLFKEAFGKSPHQYLTTLRLEEAQRLLEKGDSVTEACFAVGFESLPSFTLLFKKTLQVSPKEYAATAQEKQNRQKAAPLAFVPGCFAKHYGWEE